MGQKPLECTLCKRRYGTDAVADRRFIPSTCVCALCYRKLQGNLHSASCFGKPTVILAGGKRLLGYDPACEECQYICPDRRVCALVLTGTGELPSFQAQRLLWARRIERALAAIENAPLTDVVMQLRDDDYTRLLTLRAWMLRYKVDLQFILRVLFDYYAKHRKRRFRTKVTLGVRIPTLTGIRSRQVLEEAILQYFPQSENIALYRVEAQRQILEAPTTIKVPSMGKLGRYLRIYTKRVLTQRRVFQSAEKKYQRAWRGNPWR